MREFFGQYLCMFKGEHNKKTDAVVCGIVFWTCTRCGENNYRDR